MSRNQRFVLLGVAAVIAVAAVIVISTGGSDEVRQESSGPTTIVVKDAKPVGGIKQVTYKKGGTIDLTIDSDTANEVHFHGYDVHKDVAKGGSAQFKLKASITGEFIVELRGARTDARQRQGRAVRRRPKRSKPNGASTSGRRPLSDVFGERPPGRRAERDAEHAVAGRDERVAPARAPGRSPAGRPAASAGRRPTGPGSAPTRSSGRSYQRPR